ncbi:MAG: tetratricopeptide repeat protein [Sandaracinus sp.]
MEANETVPARELTDAERTKLRELDEAIAKFEGQKRWSDVIKSILAKADIVQDPSEKVALLTQAGTMYLEKSSNQAEAIKAFEAVLEHDSHNLQAITQLKEMYEKRRDWEKLVRVMEREVELMDESDRALRYVEMAQLATERLRKPEICIDLWQKVRQYDPDQHDALVALSGLYERAREWKPLADVLERQAERAANAEEQKAVLTKLGMIYADKLNDDHGAVSAFQRLLALDPEDKRAQEQLKRRYVAIKAWDDLEAFYAPSGKFDELIRTFEREAGNKDAPKEEQIDLMFRVARLWQRQDKNDRAAKAYEKVLELDPKSFDAAVALSPIYESVNDSKKLAGVYEVRLEHVSDPGERIALLRETGLLYEEKLKKPDLAFARFLSALELDPMQGVLREDVARLAPAVSGWDQVIATYRKAIEASGDPEASIDLQMQLGGVLEGVGKIEEAIAQFRAVYDAQSDHMGAIGKLETLYRQTSKFGELIAIYDRRLDLETDPDAKKRIAYGRASLLENELQKPDDAIDAYRAILAEWGDDEQDAYRALDTLFEKQSRFQDLADTLERRIDLGPPSEEELAALKFRLARVLEQHLNDRARALDLYREVVTLVPEHDGARVALEAFLPDPALGALAATILEPIYEVRSDWESLIRALEVLVTGAEDPARKLELLTKVGEVAGAQIGDAGRAFDAFGRALRAVPEHGETLERLEAIADAQNRWADLVALLGELAGGAEDPALSRSLWIRAAVLHDQKRGDVDAAVAAFNKVLEQDPADAEVLDALEDLYRRAAASTEDQAESAKRYRELLGVLRKKAELTSDGAAQEQLLTAMADIHEQLLGEPDQAIALHREILELDPTSKGALGALDRLLEKQALWTDLADNIGRQLALATEPDEQTALMLKLATLRETRMGAADAAIEIHRDVLQRDPSNTDALGALERLLQVPAHQPVITEILEPHYRDANDFEKLIGVHEIQAQHASSAERRVELLHRIAELYEIALDNAPKAFESFARALGEDPANTTTQEQLERLAGQTGDFESLAKVYEQRVDALVAAHQASGESPGADELALTTGLLTKAADIRENNLADVTTAIAHHERVLSLDPSNLGAASALERLFQQAEQYERLAQILLTKANMLEVPDEKKEHLFRAAAIYEEILERKPDAITVYRKVLEVDREELAALDKLIELFLGLENWPEVLNIYTLKADVVADPEEKKRLHLEVGAVYERELGDAAKAIDSYQRILEIDPEDLTAIQRLDALYLAAGNWQELLQILEREADLAGDPNEVISYRFRIADLYDHKLGDAGRAVDGYAGILEVVPDHQPTLDALENMIKAGKEPVRAATTLEPIYQQFGEWAKLVAVLEVQVTHETDPVRRVELLHRVAELTESQLDQGRAAFDAHARAITFDNANENTLASLERLAADLGTFAEVTKLYDAELAKVEGNADAGPDRIVDLGMRAAQIYEVHLGDVESAIARYNRVLAADDTHAQAIESLDRLYESTGKWTELAGILGKEAQLAASPEQMLDFQFRLGQVYETHLGQVDRAIDQYKEILGAAPEHAPALSALEALFANGTQPLVIAEILEPLYRMSEAFDRLVGVHEVQLEHITDPAERVAQMHKIAELAEERAAEPQLAFEWHQRALLEDPLNERSVSDTDRLAAGLQNWEQLASTLADVLEDAKDPAVRVAVGRRLARIYENELADVPRAVEAHLFVLTADPKDAETLEALDRIYTENGASEALQEVLASRAAALAATEDADKPTLVELHFRRAQVLENDLGRIDEAVAVYTNLLDKLDKEHEGSIRALSNIYVEKQDWRSLSRTFERELEVALGDSGRADVLAKMARLAEDNLQEPDRAVALWKQVLDLRGEDPEALNALGDLHAKAGRWNDLVEVLDREAGIAADDEVRVEIFSDLGRIWYGKLKNDRNAIDNWQRVLDIDPTNTTALFALVEIYKNAGQTQERVDSLHRVIEVGTATLEESIIESCYMQLGQLYETAEDKGGLARPADAIDAFNKALDLNPRNFGAMDALERLHAEASDWVEQVQVMERRVDALDDGKDKIPVLLAIADTWANKQSDPDRGTSAYQRILSIDPKHVVAFEELDKLHRAAERWDELVEMLLTRVENTEGTAARVKLLREVAEVQEKHLGDKEQAFGALQIAWEEDYTDRETADEIERLAGLTQKWNELLAAANAALQQVTDPATKIAICLSCAKWYGTQLGHPEYAIPYYQQILGLDPANVPAMRQMADLYRSTQQYPTLAQVLGRLVDITSDPSDKASVYVQMGELAEQHLNVPEQARTYYKQALDTHPTHVGALEALERVYRQSGEWNELLDILRRKADALGDPHDVLEAKLQIAETYEDRTGNVDEAIATYQQVLAADAQNLRAMKGLERLYAQKERWPELLQVLEGQYDVVTTEKERITILLRVAAMWEEEFVKPDKAAERLEKVVEIDPTNEQALSSLERIYKNAQRWDQLIYTLERHVSATSDRGEKQRLLAEIGDTYHVEIKDLDKAVDAYLNITSINADNVVALDALARIYDKRGDHSQSLDAMHSLARQIQDPQQVVDLRFRMGKLLDEKLGDRASAVDQYQSALDVEPGHLPSLEAMRKIHLDSGDWLAAAKTLEQEAQYQQQPRLVARHLVELGRLYDDKLDEHDKAVQTFEAALKQDGDNEDAALPLAEEYSRKKRFAEAIPLLDMLVKRSGKRDVSEQHKLAQLLGDAAAQTGDTDAAVKALSKAHQLDQQNLSTLIALSNAYYAAKRWDDAFKYFQMVLVHHRDSLEKDDLTDVFYKLGVIKREQGDRRKALNMFDKALEEDAKHRPTLEAVVGLYEQSEDWEQVIHFKKQILDIAKVDERFKMNEAIGDLWHEKLKNVPKALESYNAASELQPKNHKILHKLLMLYQGSKQWDSAIEIIERVSSLVDESDGSADAKNGQKAKYQYTIGVILRDEVKDPDRSVEYFNRSLDLDPGQLKPFEAINKIFTTKKDWKQLERAFRKMLHRISGKGNDELEWNLWHNLGVIYRDRLKQPENAVEAFKVASSKRPEDVQEHLILAELYSVIPGRTEDAIAEHQFLLKQDPYRVDSYQALYRLYFDARAYDKAWCLASTLVFLKKADAEQTQYFEQYRVKGPIRPTSRLDDERWLKDLAHPDEDLIVSKIFQQVWPAILSLRGKTDKDAGLAPKYLVDPAQSTVTLARTFGFVAQVLGIQAPRLYLRPDVQGGLSHLPVYPLASLSGSTLLQGFQPQDLMFIAARHLSDYRGEHYIRTLMPSNTELKTVLMAALRLAQLVPGDAQIDQWATQLGTKLQPAQRDVLGTLGRRFVQAGARTDVKKWLQGVEVTACRAGFLICNDLDTAARMITALGATGPVDLAPKDKIKELVLFSVSEEYFRLRQALGIQLQVQ